MNNTTNATPKGLPTNVLALMTATVERKALEFFPGAAWIVTRSFSSSEWLRFDLSTKDGPHDLTFMVEVWGTDENDTPDQYRTSIRSTHDGRERGMSRRVFSGLGATVNEAVKTMELDRNEV